MPELRITAGSLRGRRVPIPRGEVRPTSERARQAFFDILGPRISGAQFLDLFAGSGIFSFEAVSRGAAEAIAIDASRESARNIEKLASEWNVAVKAKAADVLAGIKHQAGRGFDVIYADPPYDWAHHDDLLKAIDEQMTLNAEAVVAIEHRRRSEPFSESQPSRLRFVRRAEYGEVWISFFSAEE